VANTDPTPDWRPLFAGHDLSDELLVKGARTFIAQAQEAQTYLRQWMTTAGMAPADRTLAHCWHGVVPQRGTFSDGGGYWFHGIGCVIKLADRVPVDVDWEGAAMLLDAWKMQRWFAAQGAERSTVDAIVGAMNVVVADGEVLADTRRNHFRVLPR
jgi:hypothetical protein